MLKKILSVLSMATVVLSPVSVLAAQVTASDNCPLYDVPMSPKNLTVTATTLTTVTLSWTPGCGFENTTRIYYSLDSGKTYSEAPRIILPYTSTVVDGLAPHTVYSFYVRGYDSARQVFAGEVSNIATATTEAPSVTPAPAPSPTTTPMPAPITTPPVPAVCPALAVGDLIKVDGAAAIYTIDSNNHVYYFPSGDEFKSWNVDEKYGGYTKVSQVCYDSLPLPTASPLGVNFRPGSFVVKRPSSSQLYVVEPGNTLAKITAEAAKALYGSAYTVMTVPDVFWPNYINRGADITSSKVHPGMVISYNGKQWYVDFRYNKVELRELTASAFTANRFKKAFVRPVTSAMVEGIGVGETIDGVVYSLSDRTQLSSTP